MSTAVVVSPRGQITLPAAMRKRLGIKPGGVVVQRVGDFLHAMAGGSSGPRNG